MSTVKKVINNSVWIILCRILKVLLGAVVSILTARLFGSEDFGLLNYASALISFISPLVLLGFNSTLVKEFLSENDEGTTLGTAIIASMCCSLIGMAISVGISFAISPNDRTAILVTAVYSITLFFHATELIQYWFQAKYRSRDVGLVGLVTYLVVTGYKILLLVLRVGIYWFALSNALDYLLVSAILLFIYIKEKRPALKFSLVYLKRMLKSGIYYAVSAFMVNVFTHVDSIMIKSMLGNSDNGIYSVAIICAGMFTFFFAAIIEAVRPYILEGKNQGDDVFEHRIKQLYTILIYLGIICGVLVFLGARLMIGILYGEEYSQSADVLKILIWSTVLSCIGGAKDIWILAEQKQRYLLYLNTAGVLCNIIVNMLLIPLIGIKGAAIATVTTQFMSNICLCFFIKDLRRNAFLLVQSLDSRSVIYKTYKWVFANDKRDKKN